MHKNIESLLCTPKTNRIFYVKYTSIKTKENNLTRAKGIHGNIIYGSENRRSPK